MSLKEQLQRDANQALKAREAGRRRLSVIRLLRAAVTNAEKEDGKQLGDDEVLAVIAREARRLQNDAAEYRRLGREDRAVELEQELEIVRGYLPAQLGEAEILEAVRRAIIGTGASGPGDLGKVMRVLMPEMRGKADGRLVNEIVRKALS
jgi:hypothetical protein